MNIDINGILTNYIDTGAAMHGTAGRPTVLFLHGWAAPISLYQRIFDKLGLMGYRVAAFDMPGVGGTPEPPQPLTLEDYVALTLEFCRRLDIDQCILMCHSHGGRVALSLLGDPHCPIKWQKAVLIDAAGIPAPKPPGWKMRQGLYKAAKALGTAKATAPLFGGLYEEMRDKRASDDYKAASPIMRQTMNNVLPADLRPLMPAITAPTLLVWGETDTATPLACGQEMERLIPGAGLAVIKNAGHFSFAENWAQFSAVLDAFL